MYSVFYRRVHSSTTFLSFHCKKMKYRRFMHVARLVLPMPYRIIPFFRQELRDVELFSVSNEWRRALFVNQKSPVILVQRYVYNFTQIHLYSFHTDASFFRFGANVPGAWLALPRFQNRNKSLQSSTTCRVIGSRLSCSVLHWKKTPIWACVAI